jgi:hypothetical protein
VKKLYLVALCVLVIGLASAGVIYLTVEEPTPSAASYVIVDGKAYPIAPGASRTYVRELQRFGGKTAVLFDELNRWFADLWQGKALAVTLAWISVFSSAGLFLLGRYL